MNKGHEEILLFLYRFRFLTREQFQKLFGHKYHRTTLLWLNNLTQNDYIRRYYNSKTINTPAVYSLGLKGKSYLKENSKELKIKSIVLNRIWREQNLSVQFRYRCLTIADIYLSLFDLTQKNGTSFRFFTKSDLFGVKDLPTPHPDIFFHIKNLNNNIKYCFIDIFDYFTNQIKFQKRIEKYYDYYDENTWQDSTNNCSFPAIIFVCSDKKSYGYLN